MPKDIKKELVTIEMQSGYETLMVDGYVEYYVDVNYGADADGNRGCKKTFVWDVSKISAYRETQAESVDLSAADLERAAELLTREFLGG